MMKHEIVKQLDEMEKKGIDRRRFLKFLAAAGLLVGAHSEARAFSSNAKGKIVIIGGGAAGISMAARLKRWLNEPNITLIDPSDRQFYQPGFTSPSWRSTPYGTKSPHGRMVRFPMIS